MTANAFHQNLRTSILALCALFLLAGCSSAAAQPAPDPTEVFKSALLTATYAVQQPSTTFTPTIPLPTATATVEPTATRDPNRTPSPLPDTFTSEYLNPLDIPHTYIDDTCQYLKMRWDPNNASPGTVVMAVMFHSIVGGEATQPNQISHDTLMALARDLKDQGFEAISAQQLNAFLTSNAKIPERSVILIVDDRHYADYYETHFKPLYEEFGWPVVNGWISHPDTLQEVIDGNVRLQAEGWVDHQGHGVIHNIPISEDSPDEYIRSELFGSASYIQEVYGQQPIVYIWPGGGFTPKAAAVAREAQYNLGFTVNPRGPLMFNWVPLADTYDPARPTYIAEGPVNDPLMVLPRYWDQDASLHIDEVRIMGKEAKAYAQQNKAVELEYYDIVCQPAYGDIPTSTP